MMRGFSSLAVVAASLFGALLYAQSGRARISGVVTDPKGAVVAGVHVVARNAGTLLRYETATNETGLYNILNLPFGAYSLSFEKEGFRRIQRDNITIGVNQAARLDIELQLGTVTDSITVRGDAPLLETENAEVGTTMDGRIASDLPLNVTGARSIESFAYAVTASVEGDSYNSHIAGGADFTKEVLIDGTSAVSQIGGWIGESSPSMEAVAEFKVQTSGISAEYGRTGGGVFNFALKSGTNELHGSAFAFLRNEIFDANTWQNNALAGISPDQKAQYARPKDRQYLWGLSAGLPLKKNRTFLFGAWEPYRQDQFVLGGSSATVPTPQFLNGDFSSLLNTNAAPLGKDSAGNAIYPGAIIDPKTGTVFPGNLIPPDRFSSVSKKIIDLYQTYYQPMLPGRLTNNSAMPANVAPVFKQKQLTLKGDHDVSERNRLSASYIWTDRPRTLADQGGIWDPNDPTGGPLAMSRLQEVTSHAVRLSDTYTVRPNLVITNSLGFNRYRNQGTAFAALDQNWPSALGFGDIGGHNFPGIDFGGAVNGIGTTGIGFSNGASRGFYVSNVYLLNSSASWIKGHHSVKFGVDIRKMQMNSHQGPPTLSFSFSNNQTGVPNASWSNQVGFGFASFLLGEVQNASMSVPFDLYGRRNYYALYAQDDWKVSAKLTLNVGLRWELTSPYTEKYGRWANFSLTNVNAALGIPGALEFADNGNTSFEGPRDWKELGPRVGVAYRFRPGFVFRGSYGIYYSPIGLNFWSGVPYGFAPGYQGVNQVPITPNLAPAFNWDNGYPGIFTPPVKDPNFTEPGMVTVDPNSLKAGYIQQWNLGVEHEFGRNFLVRAEYLGNKGSRLQSGELRRNQPLASQYTQLLESGNEWNWVSDAASAAAAGVPYPYPGFSNYAFMALAPYPQVAQTWSPLYFVGSPLGKSSYHALQLTFSKRLAGGVTSEATYTLSRARSNVDTGWEETWLSGSIQDVAKLAQEANTVMPIDRTHIFKGYVLWELPFGRGRTLWRNAGRVMNALVGGWTTSMVFRYESGAPLQVLCSSYYPGWNMGGPSCYANITSNADFRVYFDPSKYNAADPSSPANRYFNAQTFSNPPWGEFGNAPRWLSQLRGPGGAYENLGILKHFPITERVRLQLRAEFLNIFNRHYFDPPVTDLASPYFGQVISTSGTPRQGQLGARLEW